MRVLIVDDHPIVISGCKALLAADPEIQVSEAGDGDSGFDAYLACAPDVAVIDINLPGLSGFELTRRILRRDPDARIVIFSMNDDAVFAARAIEAGAKGYIAKNDDPLLFVGALRQIAAGGVYLPADLARKIAFAKPGDLTCAAFGAGAGNSASARFGRHHGRHRRQAEYFLQDCRQ